MKSCFELRFFYDARILGLLTVKLFGDWSFAANLAFSNCLSLLLVFWLAETALSSLEDFFFEYFLEVESLLFRFTSAILRGVRSFLSLTSQAPT